MWLTETAFVREPIALASSSGSAYTSFAPANSQVRVTAPYSCLVVSTSSPGLSFSDRMTAFSPAVAFGTNTTSSARAPTKAASTARASAVSSSKRRARNSTGLRSSSRCSSW